MQWTIEYYVLTARDNDLWHPEISSYKKILIFYVHTYTLNVEDIIITYPYRITYILFIWCDEPVF